MQDKKAPDPETPPAMNMTNEQEPKPVWTLRDGAPGPGRMSRLGLNRKIQTKDKPGGDERRATAGSRSAGQLTSHLGQLINLIGAQRINAAENNNKTSLSEKKQMFSV